jgi:hypothetical protein
MTGLVARRARLPTTYGALYSSSGTTEERRRQPWGSGLGHNRKHGPTRVGASSLPYFAMPVEYLAAG